MAMRTINASDMRPGGLALLHLARSTWSNRVLAWEMAKRELLASNKGTLLGLGWLIIRPFIQVAAYVVVVSFIFGLRPTSGGSRFTYALYVLSGMVPWQLMTRMLEEAPSLIRSRTELLRQVIYPLEILPLTSMFVASIGPAVGLAAYVTLAGVSGALQWSIILLPLPFAILALMLVGSAWLLMVFGMLIADLKEVISVALGLLVYMSPVVLSEAVVSPRLWRLLQFNPLFQVIVCFRDIMNLQFHPVSWLIYIGMALGAIVLGAFAVSRAKRIFSEHI